MNKVSWIIFIAVIVLLFGGLIVWTRITNPPIDVSGINNGSILAASEASGDIGDHIYGNKDSKVVLVEYGDFQCPSCAVAHPNVKTLMEEYGDKIALVFRNFPLVNAHPNARAASGAAEAAGLQGKYWEMYDKLFENQNEWSNADASQRFVVFKSYADTLGLNAEKFEEDFSSSNVNKKISFDQALGKQNGVTGTPNFFLDGKLLSNEAANGLTNGNLDEIKKLLDEKLAETK